MKTENIRNFAMCGHIDHGKSTLADRIMEICQAVERGHQEQLLDSLELEREHGITIKLKAVRLQYKSSDPTLNFPLYTLNLIDTPGHVDFSYEVSRSLASVEGAVLVVDATQGVQAQTLANFNLSLEANLTIVPVINKIDSPQANIEKTVRELRSLGFSKSEIIKVSAKTGQGVRPLIEEIVKRVLAPQSANTPGVRVATSRYTPGVEQRAQALIFDSSLDPFKGVVATVRLFGGQIKVGDKIKFLATSAAAEVLQIGYLTPKPKQVGEINDGEIGFIVTNIKDLSKVTVGDTLVDPKNPSAPLPGYKEARPVVFLSFYPLDPHDHEKLKTGLEKLKLNDASLTYSSESSVSLGQGFRCGFLGLLHAQITQERLEREYDLDILVTSPSVNFEIDGRKINKPQEFDPQAKSIREPIALVTIFGPGKFYGAISDLVHKKRGEVTNIEDLGNSQKIVAEIPLLELITGFYDQLKSSTSGFASFDFEVKDYKEAKLVKLDILVNHEAVEGLSQIVHAEKTESFGRKLVEKLKEVIPRQQISIPVQAAIGSKIIARETVPAFRKDVTQKLYGGDVTRKRKLLEKQKKGKRRMRRFGQVEIPQEAFLAVLKI